MNENRNLSFTTIYKLVMISSQIMSILAASNFSEEIGDHCSTAQPQFPMAAAAESTIFSLQCNLKILSSYLALRGISCGQNCFDIFMICPIMARFVSA